MTLFLLFSLSIFTVWAQETAKPVATADVSLINASELQLSRADHIIGEHIVNMLKLIEKGYINQEILKKVQLETSRSKSFAPFVPWLNSIKEISTKKTLEDLIAVCSPYSTRIEKLPLEQHLERIAGNYCRERTLEAIGREIEKTQNLSDSSLQFIQQNLRFFLTRKNKKNFAYFVQSQTTRPEILKKLSTEVSTYSVQHDIVPSQEVLKDILINEQITRLIQAKGFNPLQHQNVFYAEYGKLIEAGYKVLNPETEEKKAKEHYNYLKNYLELNQDHLPLTLCLTRLNDFAKAVFRNGFKDLSRDIFKFVIKKNVKDIYEDAMFFYMWTYLATDDYKTALNIAKTHNLLKEDSKLTDARLWFWIGYSHERLEKPDIAIKYYDRLVLAHPLSYYSIMSSKRLQSLKKEAAGATFYKDYAVKSNGKPSIAIKDLDADHVASLVRLRAWAKIDTQKMLNLELKRLSLHSMPNLMVKQPTENQFAIKSDLHLVNARIIQESKNHLATFRYLYGVLDKKEVFFNRDILEILYPKPFLTQLTTELKKDSLDPLVVLSLIRQESVFNPLARSPVGARGLMQLMPTTAKRMRNSVRDQHLIDPVINIQLGTKYFKGLMKRYDSNLVYVLCAYNAGETRVERWKKLYWDSDDTILKNIEAIPFLETRNYVKLIFRNIFFYKMLLEKKELTDNGEPNKIFDVELGFKR